MTAEAEVIIHTVTVSDATVSQFGFGIPFIAAFHNYWPDDIKTFSTSDEMTLAPYNVPVTSIIYRTAQKLKSQNPSPPNFKVGKLTGSFSHIFTITPRTPLANEIFSITINGTVITYTAPSSGQTLAALLTAMTASINGAALGITATSDASKITCTASTAGVYHVIADATANLTIADTTALPATTPATDLARLRGIDGDWYGLIVTVPGKAVIANVAAWAETTRVLYLAPSPDGDIPTSATGDIATSLKNSSYHRSSVWSHPNTADCIDGAIFGAMLPKLPGPITFANKGLAGVEMQSYDDGSRGYIKAKKANCYQVIKGLGFTLWGWAASGRFLDVMVAVDWFDVGITDRIVLLLRNNDVVPFTDKGIETVRVQVEGQIKEGITLGIIDGAQPWGVTAPKVADISAADKASRILPNIRYTYTLSGAIHSVKVIGVVKV